VYPLATGRTAQLSDELTGNVQLAIGDAAANAIG
jgi:hypothetical protein